MKTKTVTITDENCGEPISTRITLPPVALEMNDDIGTGYWRRAIYIGPKSGRVIVKTFSQWVRSHNDSRQVGVQYHEADKDEIARLAEKYPEIADELDKIVIPIEL